MPASWKNSLADFPYYAVGKNSARQWLELDLEGMGFSKSGTDSIRKRAASEYAEIDPGFVIGNLDSFEFDSREKAEIFKDAFTKMKETPEEAERLISSLASEADKVSAREQHDLVTAAMTPKRDLKPT